MRITSGHIIELAAAATSRQQSNVADATNVASSGLRVQQASDDPAAWAAAQRDLVRETLSQGNAQTISSARETLDQTDGAFTTLSGIVSQARALAVQGANSTLTPSQRADMGLQVQAMFQSALATANTQTGDGSYVLAGTKSTTAPFDANGVFQGDAIERTGPTGEHNSSAMNVSGSVLTAASGVDVLPELQKLATALSTNDVAGIQAGVDSLAKVTDQVSTARARVGTGLAALNDADTAQKSLSMNLQGFVSSLVNADAVTAASNLARATQALDVTQAVTSHVIATLSNNT